MINPCVNLFIISTCFIVNFNGSNASLVSWLFGSEDSVSGSRPFDRDDSDQPEAAAELVTSEAKAKFEIKSADDKFLALSEFTKDLSPLDICHHKVVAELTSTCSELSEEEMGKLAVQLLNCQSQAEGRPVFPCTIDMTIGECTGDMDPVTWNAYQIVSNRARAVCYATRQDQFQMRTEYTVNKLVHTTRHQLDALGAIQDGHDQLSAATKSTLDQVHESQKSLTNRQRDLLQANKNVNSYIVGNIKELTREKALIASGNKELAAMAEGLKAKLEAATEKLMEQESSQKSNHDELLQDLASIRGKAKDVWEKIDTSSKDMLSYREETTEHYRQTLASLQRVNHTIAYLESTIQNTQAELESKLDWIVGLVGGNGDKVALLSTLFLHAVYLVLGALSSAFLQTPRFSRLLLLALVPLNAWAQVHTGNSLGFLPMTAFIALTVATNWLFSSLCYLYGSCRKTKSAVVAATSGPLPSTPTFCKQKIISLSEESPDLNASIRRVRQESRGLSSPDIHKLVNILENMYKSGVLKETPKDDVCKTPTRRLMAMTHLETPDNPPPTPNSTSVARSVGEKSLVRRHLLDKLEDSVAIPPTSSTPVKSGSPAPSHCSTPIRPSCAGGDGGSPDLPAGDTPPGRTHPRRDSLCGTPTGRRRHSELPRTPRRSETPNTSRRLSTPNRSCSRPVCLATTLSGHPCKNYSSEGSVYCHRHQAAKD